jgi:hypothetical protein
MKLFQRKMTSWVASRCFYAALSQWLYCQFRIMMITIWYTCIWKQRHKNVGKWRKAPPLLKFAHRSPYPRWDIHSTPCALGLVGPENPSGHGGGQTKLCSYRESKPGHLSRIKPLHWDISVHYKHDYPMVGVIPMWLPTQVLTIHDVAYFLLSAEKCFQHSRT